MRILSHYFVARFLGLFLTVLASSLLLLGAIELVLNLEELGGLPARNPAAGRARFVPPSLPPALQFLWNRIAATYLTELIPVSGFVASFLTFAQAGRRLEWTAIEGGGIRPFRVVLPVLATTCLLAIGATAVHEAIVLPTQRASLSADRFELDGPLRERRGFWYHKGPILTNIGFADPTTRTLHDVELFERGLGPEAGRILRIVRSHRVRVLESGAWRFARAAVWQFDPDDPEARPSYRSVVGLELDLETLPENALVRADPAVASFRHLARHLEVAAERPTPNDLRLVAAYHDRLARPLRMVALGWIAVAFGMRVDRRGHFARSALAALIGLGLLLAATSGGASLTRLALLPPGLASWAIPLLAIAAGAVPLARRGI